MNPDIFKQLELKPIEGKVLVYFFTHEDKEITSREIEHEMNMRQPEVSIAINGLMQRGWIDVKKVKHGRGRPIYYYSLKMSKKLIIKQMITRLENKLNAVKYELEQLL